MVKAIETIYKGYRFRSRLEARYGVYFDALNVKWDYEVEGYDLELMGWYLPDFWFPTFECFGEVKPIKLTEIEFIKASSLKHPCILFDGAPSARYYAIAGVDLSPTYQEYLQDTTEVFCYIDILQSEHKQRAWHEYIDTFSLCWGWAGIYHQATLDAKQARFEHGQVGAPSEWSK